MNGDRRPLASLSPEWRTSAIVGRRLRWRRRELRMPQATLAASAGLPLGRVEAIEEGRHDITVHELVTLAWPLGINPGALLGDIVVDIPDPCPWDRCRDG